MHTRGRQIHASALGPRTPVSRLCLVSGWPWSGTLCGRPLSEDLLGRPCCRDLKGRPRGWGALPNPWMICHPFLSTRGFVGTPAKRMHITRPPRGRSLKTSLLTRRGGRSLHSWCAAQLVCPRLAPLLDRRGFPGSARVEDTWQGLVLPLAAHAAVLKGTGAAPAAPSLKGQEPTQQPDARPGVPWDLETARGRL